MLALSGVSSAQAWAITSSDAIAKVNALRTASGIPPLTEDVGLSAACQAHASYGRLNRGWDPGKPHGETPGKPGYTPAGHEAAQKSVLASSGWFDPNPWSEAPAHLASVLAPGLQQTGFGEDGGYMCLDTASRLGLQRPDLFTYPGPDMTGIPPAFTAAEMDENGNPFTPGVSVGIPLGTATGPYIYLYMWPYFSGPIQASLVGPSGPVSLAQVGGLLIATAPLVGGTTYTASVNFTTDPGHCIRSGSPELVSGNGSSSSRFSCAESVYGTWCTTGDPSAIPPGPANPYPYRVCAPGEAYSPPEVDIPPQQVARTWRFTTAAVADEPDASSADLPVQDTVAPNLRQLRLSPRTFKVSLTKCCPPQVPSG